MPNFARTTLFRTTLAAFALGLTASPTLAIDGGALAGRNPLSRATVGIGTISPGARGGVSISRCSGVLIAPTLVLTAAHCVAGDPYASVVILYDGAKPVAPAIPVASVSRYDVAPADLPAQYRGLATLSLDTAVLRLARPVRGRMPVRVSHGAPPPSGLRLAGTGLSDEGLGTLKTTHLDPLIVTPTGLIIAQTRGSEVCRGDSGGPVVADGAGGPVLFGVASAVLARQSPCGRVVVIAPVNPRL